MAKTKVTIDDVMALQPKVLPVLQLTGEMVGSFLLDRGYEGVKFQLVVKLGEHEITLRGTSKSGSVESAAEAQQKAQAVEQKNTELQQARGKGPRARLGEK